MYNGGMAMTCYECDIEESRAKLHQCEYCGGWVCELCENEHLNNHREVDEDIIGENFQ